MNEEKNNKLPTIVEDVTKIKKIDQDNYETHISKYEEGIKIFLQKMALPNEGIFQNIEERISVFQNAPSVINKINTEQKEQSLYISKFLAAVGSGLFDAALNYLWDETIIELRKRVAQYDLQYFFSNAVGAERAKKLNLKVEEDLKKISEDELIHGAHQIDLISYMGFKHLDYVRHMRNHASAAHPNSNEITGLQLISWLETCIREVISLPISDISVQIKRILTNIKENELDENDANKLIKIYLELDQIMVDNLVSGFYGIYIDKDTKKITKNNIKLLLLDLWPRVSIDKKRKIGVRYGQFIGNQDKDEAETTREFLDLVNGQEFIPDSLRSAEIETILENLIRAHRGINNFYNEDPFVRELYRAVGNDGNVPEQIQKDYVLTIVDCFLTNSNGVAWSVDPIYKEMISLFNDKEAFIAVTSFKKRSIASKLQFSLCVTKYQDLLQTLESKVTKEPIRELISDLLKVKNYNALDRLSDIDNKIKNVKTILSK
ncbi:MAG: hypothetical protein OEZ22_14535 [Spirochaetia bacterium]|nr:hypothetical protein [Spirochaetia bacterium]